MKDKHVGKNLNKQMKKKLKDPRCVSLKALTSRVLETTSLFILFPLQFYKYVRTKLRWATSCWLFPEGLFLFGGLWPENPISFSSLG